jgi:hypothetical protein
MSTKGYASSYKARKAKRLAGTKPEWIINPATGEEFYLRPVGGLMSNVLAGYMPGGLTQIALEAWKEQKVAGLEDAPTVEQIAAKMTPEQIAEGDGEMAAVTEVVQQMCVIPFLSRLHPSQIQFSDEWKKDAIRGLKEKDPAFNSEQFDPTTIVLNPKELDDKDATFLIRWAQGLAGVTPVKGGNVIEMDSVERFREEPGVSAGASVDKPELSQTA